MAANRTKTIEYMLPMITGSTSTGTTHTDTADTTLYIPETTSRAFLSVFMEVVVADTVTTATDMSAWSLRGSCDAGSNWTTATQSAAYANSGENQSHLFFVDMTAEFTTRFGTGATGTFRYGIYLNYASASTFTNVSAKLYITYEYDDTAHTTTRVKTVRIPIESINGRVANAAGIIRQGTITNQIPALDTFLPEASKVYRQIFAELWTNTLPSATTDCALTLGIDSGGGTTTFGTVKGNLSSPIALRFLWDLTSNADLTKDATHDIYANHNVSGQSYFLHLGGWITVTYEYNPSTSTTIMNSIITGIADGTLNARTSGDKELLRCIRWVQEPGTITLQQSGIFVSGQCSATSTTFSFGAGSQTVTGYTPTSGTGCAGMLMFMHRIDSGGFRGAGITLSRGKNTLDVQWYAATADLVGNVSCMLILNYTSDKHASGDGVHTHSTFWGIFPNNRGTSTSLTLSASVTPKIIETDFWLVGAAPCLYGTGLSGTIIYYSTQCEVNAGEDLEAGWKDLFGSVSISSNERQFQLSRSNARDVFKRWPLETDTSRLALTSARTWRFGGVTAQWGMGFWLSHHSITYTISGIVKNYSGDGSGISVDIFRTDDDTLIGTATTAAGGTYSLVWYDNTIQVYAHARQSSSLVGRSDNGVAS